MVDLLHHNSGVVIPRDEYEELTDALATVFRIGARFTPKLIERLDLIDGDPDIELNGDETDPDRAEDCFSIGKNDHANGPGCR